MRGRRVQIPASCRGLESDAVKKALTDATGDLALAARKLSVPCFDLRRFMLAKQELAARAYEEVERALDRAQAVVFEGLRSSDYLTRLRAAKFMLKRTDAGRRRGFGGRARGAPGGPRTGSK
jgi:hypothetical protein